MTGDKVIVGTQGPFGGGGQILAFETSTGSLLWSTVAEGEVVWVTQAGTKG